STAPARSAPAATPARPAPLRSRRSSHSPSRSDGASCAAGPLLSTQKSIMRLDVTTVQEYVASALTGEPAFGKRAHNSLIIKRKSGYVDVTVNRSLAVVLHQPAP